MSSNDLPDNMDPVSTSAAAVEILRASRWGQVFDEAHDLLRENRKLDDSADAGDTFWDDRLEANRRAAVRWTAAESKIASLIKETLAAIADDVDPVSLGMARALRSNDPDAYRRECGG